MASPWSEIEMLGWWSNLKGKRMLCLWVMWRLRLEERGQRSEEENRKGANTSEKG